MRHSDRHSRLENLTSVKVRIVESLTEHLNNHMKIQTAKTLSVAPVLALALVAIACDSGDPQNAPVANATESESAFIETVEATTNEAVGVIDPTQSADQDAVRTFDETPKLASDPLVFAQEPNIDGVPTKDIEIVAKESPLDASASPEDLVARELVAWESRLMDIWDSSINGVVLISLENSVFPSDGTGAGWFWDDEGHIVTNYHVVRPTSVLGAPRLGSTNKIFVETYQGDRYEAEIVGRGSRLRHRGNQDRRRP